MAINFGTSFKNGDIISYAFPRPEDLAVLDPDDLRELGFSYNKAFTIIGLSQMIEDGSLNLENLENQDDKTVLEFLRELKGIGRWTAEYVLLRGLGRIHLFPGDDVGARKNLQKWLKLKEPLNYDSVRQILSKWSPYSGFLYFHLLLNNLTEEGIINL